MSFTEIFAYGGGDESEERAQPVHAPWLAPPDDELGVAIPQGVVIARSERGAVGLSHLLVHSSGVLFEFLALARALTHAEANRLFHEQHVFHDEELPDGLLRVGMELPGGTRVSNLGGWHTHRDAITTDQAPQEPVLFPHAGGGGMAGGDRVVMHPAYWLWPLPEPGPLRISCEWPVVDIPLSTIEIDAGSVVAAASKSSKLWPSN